jgi:RNA polymerase sigma factor (sigma-70 family)
MKMVHRFCPESDRWIEVAASVQKQIDFWLWRCPVNHRDAVHDEVESGFRVAEMRRTVDRPLNLASKIVRRRVASHLGQDRRADAIRERLTQQLREQLHEQQQEWLRGRPDLDLLRGSPGSDPLGGAVGRALDALAEQHPREAFAFMQHRLYGTKLREIAEVLGCSESAVSRMVKRAGDFLKERLRE